MFSFTNKKSYRRLKFWSGLDEEDFQKMAEFHFFSAWNSWCITTQVRIDSFHIVISLSNRSSIEKSIKLFVKIKGQIAY